MVEKTLTIPAADLPFEAGQEFVGNVTADGIAHITVTAKKTKQGDREGQAFLEKWGKSLNNSAAFKKKSHADDARMLHHIEKYGLDE